MEFATSPIGHIEDNSFAVKHCASGRKLLCADTGNGGDTAYQLLRPVQDDVDDFHELGYAGTHCEIEAMAERQLATDIRYDELVAAGYPICDGTYLIALCDGGR